MKLSATWDWLSERLVQAPDDVVPVMAKRLLRCCAQLEAGSAAARRASFLDAPRYALKDALSRIPRLGGESVAFGGPNRFRQMDTGAGRIVAILLKADIGAGTESDTYSSSIASADEVIVGLDCFGGCGAEALRFYDVLRAHPRVTTIAVGSCFSSAVEILQAGRRRLAHRAARLLIHPPQFCVLGSAARLREVAEVSESALAPMAEFFQHHSGQSAAVVEGWLDGRDHYFTADEAKVAGLVDDVFEGFGVYPQALVAPEGYGS